MEAVELDNTPYSAAQANSMLQRAERSGIAAS